MAGRTAYDVVVVGSGPNGLACAIELARAGRSVLVLEGADAPGGGMRSAELTRPGFVHDVCAAIHATGAISPFFAGLPLGKLDVEWIHGDAPLAHPFDDGTAVVLERSVDATAEQLGSDAAAYRRLIGPLVGHLDGLAQVLGPLRRPSHPVFMARFGLRAARSVERLARRFDGERAPALLAGSGAHTMLRLNQIPTGSVAVYFSALAHAVGWPLVAGGTQRLADALVTHLRSLGGEIECGRPVERMEDIPPSRAVAFDLTPRQVIRIAGSQLPAGYRRRLARFRYAPGSFKVDWALSAPIPWKAAECARAATVHLGGTFEEIAASEAAVNRGDHPERPYVLLAQPSLFDPSRAPAGKHTAWAYCHLPHGSTFDMTERIEAQIERFAPGFRDLVEERSVRGPAALEAYNPNYIGGDISGGLADLGQLFTRPLVSWNPYTTPNPRLYLCSQSTPPGPGVHGMCGVFAAKAILKRPV